MQSDQEVHDVGKKIKKKEKKMVSLLKGNSVLVFEPVVAGRITCTPNSTLIFLHFILVHLTKSHTTNGHVKWHVSNEISTDFNQFRTHLLMFLKLYLHNVWCGDW